jgi:hypothetical protein
MSVPPSGSSSDLSRIEQISGVTISKAIPNPNPAIAGASDRNRYEGAAIAQPSTLSNYDQEKAEQFIAPVNIFQNALISFPRYLQSEDLKSYRSAVQDLKAAYRGIVDSLSLEGKQALATKLSQSKALRSMNSGEIVENDKRLTVVFAGLVNSFSRSDFDSESLVKTSDRHIFSEKINQLRTAFYKVLELSASPVQRGAAQDIMTIFDTLALNNRGLALFKSLVDRKSDVFSKVAVILPDLFKQIGERDLDDNKLLESLDNILNLAGDLPARFRSTLNLDSSGKSFKEVNDHRRGLVEQLIKTKPPADRENLIEALTSDCLKG